MAHEIEGNIYRVGIDSERNFTYIAARDTEDLIRFLVREYDDPRVRIYGAKEVHKDGSLSVVAVVTNPLFLRLCEEKEKDQLTNQSQKNHPSVTFIDGDPYMPILPTVEMWNAAIAATDAQDYALHWSGIYSWCQKQVTCDPEMCTCVGGGTVHATNFCDPSERSSAIGYRPALIPLDPTTLEPSPGRLAYVKDGSLLQMGTLHMDGVPLLHPGRPSKEDDIPSFTPGAALSIGDTDNFPLTRLCWIKTGDFLISDRVLLKDISWNDLKDQGLVFGREDPSSKSMRHNVDDLIRAALEKSKCAADVSLPLDLQDELFARIQSSIAEQSNKKSTQIER